MIRLSDEIICIFGCNWTGMGYSKFKLSMFSKSNVCERWVYKIGHRKRKYVPSILNKSCWKYFACLFVLLLILRRCSFKDLVTWKSCSSSPSVCVDCSLKHIVWSLYNQLKVNFKVYLSSFTFPSIEASAQWNGKPCAQLDSRTFVNCWP